MSGTKSITKIFLEQVSQLCILGSLLDNPSRHLFGQLF